MPWYINAALNVVKENSTLTESEIEKLRKDFAVLDRKLVNIKKHEVPSGVNSKNQIPLNLGTSILRSFAQRMAIANETHKQLSREEIQNILVACMITSNQIEQDTKEKLWTFLTMINDDVNLRTLSGSNLDEYVERSIHGIKDESGQVDKSTIVQSFVTDLKQLTQLQRDHLQILNYQLHSPPEQVLTIFLKYCTDAEILEIRNELKQSEYLHTDALKQQFLKHDVLKMMVAGDDTKLSTTSQSNAIRYIRSLISQTEKIEDLNDIFVVIHDDSFKFLQKRNNDSPGLFKSVPELDKIVGLLQDKAFSIVQQANDQASRGQIFKNYKTYQQIFEADSDREVKYIDDFKKMFGKHKDTDLKM